MRSANRPRKTGAGAVLLEVLVGIVLLVTAGVAMIASLGQTVMTAREVHARDDETRSASGALERVALWSRATLDARQGRSRLRTWDLQVDRLTSSVYRVAVLDTLNRATILETSIYRPDSVNAVQH